MSTSDVGHLERDLAAALKRARVRMNLTQAELADRLGVSDRSIQNWEGGKGLAQAKNRRLIAAFLKEADQA